MKKLLHIQLLIFAIGIVAAVPLLVGYWNPFGIESSFDVEFVAVWLLGFSNILIATFLCLITYWVYKALLSLFK